jgi:aminopeptidase-like protein
VSIADLVEQVDRQAVGASMHALIRELQPICRSMTGDGVRQTLRRIAREVDLQVHEVPSGTPVLDWTVPKEWTIRDAWVKNAAGQRVIDFQKSNLHVVSHSQPVHRKMSLAELRPHLHTLPEHPDWVPYKASHYSDGWGFCLADRQLQQLPDGEYEVCVDATLDDGHLTYGELVLPGDTPQEVLISSHICHPSLCNDNLSGIAVATTLARMLAGIRRRYTYRFVFAPGTIGAITWLAQHREQVDRIRHGLVLTCVGDPGGVTYKRSARGDAVIDRAVQHVLQQRGGPHELREFSPYGYDERQYNSPGFKLPVGCLMRTPHGEFPQYHTSADNADFVTAQALADTLEVLLRTVEVLERNRRCVNLKPHGEPRLGPRGVADLHGGDRVGDARMACLWVLNQSNGEHDLLQIAERADIAFPTIAFAADRLLQTDLLRDV